MVTNASTSKTQLPEPDTSATRPKRSSSDSETTKLVYSRLVNRDRPILTAKRGRWFTQNLSLTPPLIETALRGDMALGIAAVSGTGTAKWVCLDIDQDIQLFELQTLARDLWHTQAVLFEYSRRGGHLFLFHKPAPWQQSHAYGQRLAEQAGLDGVEVYPKHGHPHSVKVPGTTHPKTGRTYPIINPVSGEVLSLGAALAAITPIELPEMQVVEAPAVSQKGSEDFEWLVEALSTYTTVTVYGENKAKARCIWHPDHNPSLIIKGSRFHCQRPDCVWGDKSDFLRWATKGIRPPTH